MSVEVDIIGLKELLNDLRDFPEKLQQPVLNDLAQVAYDEVRKGAGNHVQTGALFQSVFNRADGLTRTVGHDRQRAPQAEWVIKGVKPRDIVPRNRKALRWAGPNGFIFAKYVKDWPGFEGDPYVDRAAEHAISQFSDIINRAFKDAI